MNLRCRYSSIIKVAITGSTGFIGQHLIQVFGDVSFSTQSLQEIDRQATIIHLAADISNTRKGLLANLEIDSYLLEIANKKNCNILYASSNNIYPFKPNCRPEEMPLCNTYYGASKIFGEKLIFDLAKVDVICLRIADVFGIGQKHGNLFKAIEKSIRQQTKFQQYGEGNKLRSYIHVLELCEYLKYITLNKFKNFHGKKILNLAYSDPATVADILILISKISNLPINYIPLEKDKSTLDIRTMKPTFLNGYKPKWNSFTEALIDYVWKIMSEKEVP